MESTNRAFGPQGFRKFLSRLHCRQGAWLPSVVGKRLHEDGLFAGVDDNCLVGSGDTANEGAGGGDDTELHSGGLKKLELLVLRRWALKMDAAK